MPPAALGLMASAVRCAGICAKAEGHRKGRPVVRTADAALDRDAVGDRVGKGELRLRHCLVVEDRRSSRLEDRHPATAGRPAELALLRRDAENRYACRLTRDRLV